MRVKRYLAFGMLAALSSAASAQAPRQHTMQPASPLDAHAASPAAAYHSALRHYQSAPVEALTPDQAWRSANDAVGKLGGHARHDHATHDHSQAGKAAATTPVSGHAEKHAHGTAGMAGMPMNDKAPRQGHRHHGHHHHH